MEERVGEAFSFSEPLTVLGRKLQPGEQAPDFSLDYVDLIDMTIHHTRLADTAGVVRVLSIVNSLDMPICRLQTRHWEKAYASFPSDVCLYTISMDLPHAQAHWQVVEAVIHQTLSAHRSELFGLQYGLLLKEWRLLQRAVFVIARDDRIAHVEYVADQQREPDYEAALSAIMQAAS
jgi:thiol peroxidase